MSAFECQRFITNPLSYVRDVCINLQTRGRGGAGAFNAKLSYAPCWFDLVPWSTSLFGGASQVMLEPTAVMGAGLIQGYYVPYISYGNVVSTAADHIAPVLLDGVPRTLPPNSFVFTGGQNGCSLLMMNGSTPDTLSFLHYPNSDGKQNHYPILCRSGKPMPTSFFQSTLTCTASLPTPMRAASSSTTEQSGSPLHNLRYRGQSTRLGGVVRCQSIETCDHDITQQVVEA